MTVPPDSAGLWEIRAIQSWSSGCLHSSLLFLGQSVSDTGGPDPLYLDFMDWYFHPGRWGGCDWLQMQEMYVVQIDGFYSDDGTIRGSSMKSWFIYFIDLPGLGLDILWYHSGLADFI